MGTILASSGDDGCVRLWKDNYINNWKCVAVLKGDGTSAQSAENAVSTPPNSSHNLAAQQPLSTTRYYKLGSISHPNQVPWH
jgi:nucleoporin SEH1